MGYVKIYLVFFCCLAYQFLIGVTLIPPEPKITVRHSELQVCPCAQGSKDHTVDTTATGK